MDTQAPSTPPITAPPGTVCRSCWYSLKGQLYGSVCTECGASTGAGMDPLWWGNGPLKPLHAAASAARLVFWTAVGFIGAMAAVVALQILLGPPAPGSASRGMLISAASLLAWTGYLASIAWCIRSLVRARLLPALLFNSAVAGAASTLLCAVGAAALGFAAEAGGSAPGSGAASTALYRWQALLAIALAVTVLVTLLLWSLSLRLAASRIANTPLRGWGLALIGCVLLMMLAYCYTAYVLLQSVFWQSPFFSAFPSRTQLVIGQAASIAGTIAALGIAVLVVLNPHLLHRALRRFIAARIDAA